jgi:hypothetical protein
METMEAMSKQAQGYEGRADSGGAAKAAMSPLVQLPHGVPGGATLGPRGLA